MSFIKRRVNETYYKNLNIEWLSDEQLSTLKREIAKEFNIRAKKFGDTFKY